MKQRSLFPGAARSRVAAGARSAALRGATHAAAAVCLGLALAGTTACKSSTSSTPPNRSGSDVEATPPGTTTRVPTPAPSVVVLTGTPAAPLTRPAETSVAQIGTPGLIIITAARARPEMVTVQVGDTVTWENDDTTSHRVVSSTAGQFDTGIIAPGARSSVQLPTPGLYPWHDAINPVIAGTVQALR